MPAADRPLLEAGAAILGIAFLVKAGMWPLGFWLPTTYAAAAAPVGRDLRDHDQGRRLRRPAPVAAAVRRRRPARSAGFGGALAARRAAWLTIAFGTVGVLASQTLARLAGCSVLVSSGTLLAAIGTGSGAVIGGALFYLVSSTLAIAALFLLVELVERVRGRRRRRARRHAWRPTATATRMLDDDEEVGVAIPATMAVLGLCFIACALLLAGLPPLSGFLAKFAHAGGRCSDPAARRSAPRGRLGCCSALLILSGLAALIAHDAAPASTPSGRRSTTSVPRVRVIEIAPVVAAARCSASALTVAGRAGHALHGGDRRRRCMRPQDYVAGVLSARRRVGSADGEAAHEPARCPIRC